MGNLNLYSPVKLCRLFACRTLQAVQFFLWFFACKSFCRLLPTLGWLLYNARVSVRPSPSKQHNWGIFVNIPKLTVKFGTRGNQACWAFLSVGSRSSVVSGHILWSFFTFVTYFYFYTTNTLYTHNQHTTNTPTHTQPIQPILWPTRSLLSVLLSTGAGRGRSPQEFIWLLFWLLLHFW